MKIAPLVLAGGKPGAFEKITGHLPKTYIYVYGKRLFQYAADTLAEYFKKIYVVAPVPEEGNYIYIEERGEGIEKALAAADSYIESESHVLLAYGDVYVEAAAYRDVVEAVISMGADGAVLAVPRKFTLGYGVVRTGPGQTFAGFGGEGQWIFGGVALLPREVIKLVAKLSIYEALNELARVKKIVVVPWGGVWHDVNHPEDLLQLLEHLAPVYSKIAKGAKISPTAVLEGPVVVEEGAEVDHYAVLKGPVYIGREVFIGSHAFVRNYTDVEAETVVGSSVEISHSLISRNAHIGRGSYISYSVVGEGAVLEPHVVTKSVLRIRRDRLEPVEVRGKVFYKLGALIPKGARVAAGSVLEPGYGF
ncbi:MAG: NDP-sugar synthase [Pyrobaculum sp.]